MGILLRMNSDQFINKFIKECDVSKHSFILISDEITTVNAYDNAIAVKNLVPPKEVIKEYVNGGISPEYVLKYSKFLKSKESIYIISAIINEVIEKNKNVVLLCSKTEDERGYLKLLCYFIEEVFTLESVSFKKYKKLNGNPIEYDVDTIKKKLSKWGEENSLADLSEIIKESMAKKDKIVEELEGMEKKKLVKFCKKKGFTVDMDTKRKKIIKEFFNEYLSKYLIL